MRPYALAADELPTPSKSSLLEDMLKSLAPIFEVYGLVGGMARLGTGDAEKVALVGAAVTATGATAATTVATGVTIGLIGAGATVGELGATEGEFTIGAE